MVDDRSFRPSNYATACSYYRVPLSSPSCNTLYVQGYSELLMNVPESQHQVGVMDLGGDGTEKFAVSFYDKKYNLR